MSECEGTRFPRNSAESAGRKERCLSRASTSHSDFCHRSALLLHGPSKKNNLRAENQSQWMEWRSWAAAATKSLQLCLTPSNPIDYSPPGSSVHGIFQARVLEWVSIAFSGGSWEASLRRELWSLKSPAENLGNRISREKPVFESSYSKWVAELCLRRESPPLKMFVEQVNSLLRLMGRSW